MEAYLTYIRVFYFRGGFVLEGLKRIYTLEDRYYGNYEYRTIANNFTPQEYQQFIENLRGYGTKLGVKLFVSAFYGIFLFRTF